MLHSPGQRGKFLRGQMGSFPKRWRISSKSSCVWTEFVMGPTETRGRRFCWKTGKTNMCGINIKREFLCDCGCAEIPFSDIFVVYKL